MCQTTFHINKQGQITGLNKKNIQTIKFKNKIRYKTKKCKWCNTPFTPTSGHNLYCCQDCTLLAKQKHGRDRVHRFRKRYKEVLKTFTKYIPLGTGGLGEHPTSNFKEEQEKIIKELKKLGIR